VLGPTPALIEVLEPEHQSPRAAARVRPPERKRPRMSEVQASARTRCEATDRDRCR
jgi:hypothetical protein